MEATEQPMALDVFSAIALAPKPVWSFDEACDRLQAPVLMLYGGWWVGVRADKNCSGKGSRQRRPGCCRLPLQLFLLPGYV